MSRGLGDVYKRQAHRCTSVYFYGQHGKAAVGCNGGNAAGGKGQQLVPILGHNAGIVKRKFQNGIHALLPFFLRGSIKKGIVGQRIRAKLRRHIEKEAADREAEFEAAMQYHSESDIQEAYGWEFISEQQYERYLELFRQGRRELDEHSPTVTELALSILNRIFQDIDRDCRQCEFEALSLEEQLAELKRAEESRQAWRQYIASLKEMINPSAAQE